MITYKTEDEVPQYSVTIRKWNLQPTLPDALFAFTPPEGATRIEVVAFGGPSGDGRGRTAMTRQLDGGDDRRGPGARLDGGPLRPARRPRVGVRLVAARTRTRSGNTTTVQGQRATGTKTVSQTGEGYNVNKQVTTESGASKSVSKDVNVEDREVERNSTTTNQWGQSATREAQGGGPGRLRDDRGKRQDQHGPRGIETDLVAGRNRYGQPAVAGSVEHEVQRQLQRRRRRATRTAGGTPPWPARTAAR